MEDVNILQTKAYKITEEEKVTIIKNWLSRVALQLIQTLENSMKEACKTVEGLFSTLGEKLKLHHKEPFYPCNTTNIKEKGRSLPWSGGVDSELRH